MKINSSITTEIDLAELYKLCKPTSRKECAKAIREEVDFLIDMRATDTTGSWSYLDLVTLAHHLIGKGLAEPTEAYAGR